jgi:hypothetical protein
MISRKAKNQALQSFPRKLGPRERVIFVAKRRFVQDLGSTRINFVK